MRSSKERFPETRYIAGQSRLQRTPEERCTLDARFELQIPANGANGPDGLGRRNISGQHHIKVVEMVLFEAFVEVFNLLCRRLSAFPLLVTRMIAW